MTFAAPRFLGRLAAKPAAWIMVACAMGALPAYAARPRPRAAEPRRVEQSVTGESAAIDRMAGLSE